MVSYRVRRIVMFGAVLALTSFSANPRALQSQTLRVPENQSATRDWTDEVPAHLSVVSGQVTLERDGKLEPAEANLALLAGDRLRTRDGRVEILYADGSALAVDKETEVDLLSDDLIRLRDGRLRLTISRTAEGLEYRIDAAAGSVFINSAGEFRVETGADKNGDATVDLMVVRGSAELFNDHGRTLVKAGRRATTTATTEPSLPYAANSAAVDDFTSWSDEQHDARTGTVSAEYLPDEVDYYSGAFDTYGTWGYEPAYGGRVWYPRVYAGWRPYSQGRWSYTGYFGWTWVGIDRWAWPTHHYGRWGFSANRWYWVPGSAWAPAWVSWGYAPGYVSWCPVGFSFAGSGYYGYPWYATTVVPVRHFTHNVWVTQHAVNHETIAQDTQRSFVARSNAPVVEGGAIPRRDLAPLRAPTAAKRTTMVNGLRQSAGPFDSARTKTTGTSATARGPLTSTIIGTKDSPAPTVGKFVASPGQTAAPDRAPASNAEPRSAKAPVNRIEVPRAPSVDRVDVPAVAVKRYEPTRAEPRKYEPPAGSTGSASGGEITQSARPRPSEPDRYTPPVVESPKSRGQAAERYAPPSAPSSPPASQGSKGAGPSGPPSNASGPSRSGKVAAPPSSGPPQSTAPPQSSAPAPSRSGKVEAPPASAPPPARGGGGTSTASGKGRGGGR